MSSMEKIVVFGPALPMNLAPMWVAHDKGFFKEEGLDVDLRPVQGIPDSQHPRHEWRKDGAIIFQSPGGSPPFRSVLENRDHIDGEINVVSIANRTAHVFVAKPYVKDVADLKGKKIAGDLKGGSSMDAKMVMRHFGVDPEKDVTWIDSRGKPPNTERFRLALFEKGEVDADTRRRKACARGHGEGLDSRDHRPHRHGRRQRLRDRIRRRDGARAVDGKPDDDLQHGDRSGCARGHDRG